MAIRIKIAKIEISSNQWEKIGIVGNDTLSTSSFQNLCTSGFSVEVINTDENPVYIPAVHKLVRLNAPKL